ncbi:MAG: sigma-54-dependent Fis family transcriptional regulator [Nitrospirae bacterium]|nr:sigma-54-dependent Fis family transcriptional regulator [Nitrospirota bacterium]MBF0533480.1 sigma-54-dependent Fis family transcriptional regulator [Nitrospirota bacterium]MBF0615996.1 sigma-54-dependent Fis family transcriptional regulator [Nitrospirota bacterium]
MAVAKAAMSTEQILIIDDDATLVESIGDVVSSVGYGVLSAPNGNDGIELFKRGGVSAVLLDLVMDGMGGMETLQELKKIDTDVPVIIVTGYADIQSAVEATKLGAYDFVVKPPDFDKLIITLGRAIQQLQLKQETRALKYAVDTSLESQLGKSHAMSKLISDIQQVAASNFSIILQGETGTGKSYIARIIHNLSVRADKPFVKVDIGSLAESVMESELFGHEKGAFTGADRRTRGFFEAANGGTIFIDEIQNMSPNIQAKLLSVVEDKLIYPVGGRTHVDIDVRIITATNRNVNHLLETKNLRSDLYFRLGEFIMTVPPLRSRREDIGFFVNKFIAEASDELDKPIRDVSDEAMALLENNPWVGNIRELKNVIRRAVLFSDDGTIRYEHIKMLLDVKAGVAVDNKTFMSLKETLKTEETKVIRKALELSDGNRTKAAAILKISYRGLLAKMKEYDID